MRTADATFRSFPQFATPELAPWASSRKRLGERAMAAFPRDCAQDRLARALGERKVLPVKELLESFEFHSRTRRRIRGAEVADLCCGHGLTGMLFATEATVERVTLVDRRRPKSFDAVFDAVCSVFPQVRGKVRYLEDSVEGAVPDLLPGTSVIAVHACGAATDRCIDAALATGGPIAAMPCCYGGTDSHTPLGIRQTLGGELAADIDRTYRLVQAGRVVDWTFIPRAISQKNRILVGWKGS